MRDFAIDVWVGNVDEVLPRLAAAIDRAQVIAVDTEFSGFDRRTFSIHDVQARYEAMVRDVEVRTLLQLGVSCIRVEDASEPVVASASASEPAKRRVARCETFNVQLIRADEWLMSTSSGEFLAGQGLDLGAHMQDAVRYLPPGARVAIEALPERNRSVQPGSVPTAVQDVMTRMFALNKTLVVHNGLLDLMYLVHSFGAPLPQHHEQFMELVSTMFDRVVDTKYLSEFELGGHHATYLQYLFRFYERMFAAGGVPGLSIVHTLQDGSELVTDYTQYRSVDVKPVCSNFAMHGNCRQVATCKLSHDCDLAIDLLVAGASANTNTGELQVKKRHRAGRKHSRRAAGKRASLGDSQTGANGDAADSDDEEGNNNNSGGEAAAVAATASASAPNPRTPGGAARTPGPHPGVAQAQASDDVEPGEVRVADAAAAPRVLHFPASCVDVHHSAGRDAFCTGFVALMAGFMHGNDKVVRGANRVYLAGKRIPLVVKK